MIFGSYRKAIGLIVTGIPVWGAAATAENGVDRSEWWGLVALLAAGFMVWWLPNDPPVTPAPPVDPLAVEAAWVPQQLPTD